MQWKRWFTATLLVGVSVLGGCQGTLPPPETPPHRGAEVKVACPPGLGDLIARRARGWEDRQQARVVIVPTDAVGADLLLLPPAELPRHAAAGDLEPLPAAVQARGAAFDWPGLLQHYREPLVLWERTAYAAPLVGEAPVCLYRADLYNDKAHQKGFRDFQRGKPAPVRDLRAPATWEELALQADYFHQHYPAGKPRPSLPPLPDDGRAVDRLFYTVAASYARRAVPEQAEGISRAELFAFHYDIDSGKPRIATPGFVAALRLLQRLQACRPKGASASPEKAFLDGEAVLCLTEAGTLARAQQVPALRDRVGVCLVPGADHYFAPDGKRVAAADGVNRVPYLGSAGWLGAVPKGAKHAAAAMDLLLDLAGPRESMQIAVAPENGGGVTRTDQVLRDRWGAFGLDARGTMALRDTVARAVYRHGLKSPALCLRTPDEAQAREALVAALRPALTTNADAAATLQAVSKRWEELAAKRGDRHAGEYRLSLGLLSK